MPPSDDAPASEEPPESEEAPESEEPPESEEEPEVLVGAVIGRFEVLERAPGKLTLEARSRTDTFAMKWTVIVLSVLFPIGCALTALLPQPASILLTMFAGLTVSIVVVMDFGRVATSRRFVTVERWLEISNPTTEGGYRTGPKSALVLTADGRALDEAVTDVKLLSQTIPGSRGQEIHRVYIVLARRIVALEATRSYTAARRLAGLVRHTLGLGPLIEDNRETSTLGGYAMIVLLVVLEMGAVAAGVAAVSVFADDRSAPYPSPLVVGLIGAAMVVAMLVVQRLCALLMASAVRDHVRKNLDA